MKKGIWSLLVVFILALSFSTVCADTVENTTFIVYMEGSSMMDTFADGDQLFVSTENAGCANRGDVVLCTYPNRKDEQFIKRVVAIPGDVVYRKNGITHVVYNSIDEEGQDVTRDEPLDECIASTFFDLSDDYEPYVLSKDEFFVVGDNRYNSHDSRDWKDGDPSRDVGPIKGEMILGHVYLVDNEVSHAKFNMAETGPIGKIKVIEPIELLVNYTAALKPLALPDKSFDMLFTPEAQMTYSSSNECVATVDSNGVITAVGAGTALISIDDENYGHASCEVRVQDREPVYIAYVFAHKDDFFKNSAEFLSAKVLPYTQYADNIVKMYDFSREGLLSVLGELNDDYHLTRFDTTFIYFGTHGTDIASFGNVGSGFATNTDTITYAELKNALNAVNGNIVIFLDNCFSGGFLEEGTRINYLNQFLNATPFLEDLWETVEYGPKLPDNKFYVLSATEVDVTGKGKTEGATYFTYALWNSFASDETYDTYLKELIEEEKTITLSDIYQHAIYNIKLPEYKEIIGEDYGTEILMFPENSDFVVFKFNHGNGIQDNNSKGTTSEAYLDSETVLRKKLLDASGANDILAFGYADYDVNGEYEAFAILGEYHYSDEDGGYQQSGALWFIGKDLTVQCETEGGCYPDNSEVIQHNEGALFSIMEGYGGSGSQTRMWGVVNGRPYLASGSYMITQKLLEEVTVVDPAFTASPEDESDLNLNTESQLRHSLIKATGSDFFLAFECGDYDGDGTEEAYALVLTGMNDGYMAEADLWFVSGNKTILCERGYAYYYTETEPMGESGHLKFILFEGYGGNDYEERYWSVKNGEPYLEAGDYMIDGYTLNGTADLLK